MAGIVSFIMITYHSAKDNITTQDGKRDKNTAKGYKNIGERRFLL